MEFRLKRKVFEGEFENNIYTIIFGLLMGIIIISFTVWNRLIRERLPREIIGEPFTLKFWFILFMFMYFFLFMLLYLNILQKQLRGVKYKNKYVLKFSKYLEKKTNILNLIEFMINYIFNSPLYLWRFLYFNLPEKYTHPIVHYLYKFGIYINENFFPGKLEGFKREIIATTICSYIPKLWVFGIFVYEIGINKELRYFYYFAVLLLVPLIFYALRRILYDISYYELKDLEDKYLKVLCQNKEPYYFLKGVEESVFPPLGNDEEFYGKNAIYIQTNYKISQEVFELLINSYYFFWEIQRMTFKFFIIEERFKYGFYISLIIYMMLALGFLLWTLILIDIY